jgi:hypothetical protein
LATIAGTARVVSVRFVIEPCTPVSVPATSSKGV